MEIKINGQVISFSARPSYRSKYVRLAISSRGNVVLTYPARMDFLEAEKFLVQKSGWILKKLQFLAKKEILLPPKIHHTDVETYKRRAKDVIFRRVAYFNQFYKFPFNSITVRNKKTSWGSCSKKGNLSFNYKLVFLPLELVDYVVVHELCHLKEFNHSKKFWNLVGETCPNFLALRKRLKNVI